MSAQRREQNGLWAGSGVAPQMGQRPRILPSLSTGSIGPVASPRQSISVSADLTQAKCTGKPSPVSIPTASVSGSPTTFV